MRISWRIRSSVIFYWFVLDIRTLELFGSLILVTRLGGLLWFILLLYILLARLVIMSLAGSSWSLLCPQMSGSPETFTLLDLIFRWGWFWSVLSRSTSRYMPVSHGYQEISLAIRALFHLSIVQLRWNLVLKIGYLSLQFFLVEIGILLQFLNLFRDFHCFDECLSLLPPFGSCLGFGRTILISFSPVRWAKRASPSRFVGLRRWSSWCLIFWWEFFSGSDDWLRIFIWVAYIIAS